MAIKQQRAWAWCLADQSCFIPWRSIMIIRWWYIEICIHRYYYAGVWYMAIHSSHFFLRAACCSYWSKVWINSCMRSVYIKPEAFKSLSRQPSLLSMNLYNSIIKLMSIIILTFFCDLRAVEHIQGSEGSDSLDGLQVIVTQVLRVYTKLVG